MQKRERLRRVVLLCAHFARNLAYYRAGHDRLTNGSAPFWLTADSNFLDTAVLEWCKLFSDRTGKHMWLEVLTDPTGFKAALLAKLGVTDAEFGAYVDEMRNYRDKFLAHLDNLLVMDIPHLDQALAAAELYHFHVVQHEAGAGDLSDLPTDLAQYSSQCFDEAKAIYNRGPI